MDLLTALVSAHSPEYETILYLHCHIFTNTMQRKDVSSSLAYPEPDTREYTGRGLGTTSCPNPPLDASLLSIVNRRTSVRNFRSDPISDHQIHSALRVGRLAPSAGNLQAYQVVVVRETSQKHAIASAAVGQMWIAQAPVVLVFLADPERSSHKYGERGRVLYSVQDTTLAAAYCQLALEAAGLASCWVGAFHEDLVAEAVTHYSANANEVDRTNPPLCNAATSRSLRPVVVMPVGWAAERRVVRHHHHRRAIREFVHQDYISVSGKVNGADSRKRGRKNESSE